MGCRATRAGEGAPAAEPWRARRRPAALQVTLAAACGFLAALPAAAETTVERPRQFVLLSFDNCRELDRWADLLAFTRRLEAAGKSVRLTFFLSGVTLIPDAERRGYAGPHQPPGRSKIGFGGTAAEVAERARLINALRAEGHEMASHAVGHFDARRDGPAWSAQDWVRELTAFGKLAAAALGKDATSQTSAFSGFRAPYLSVTPGLHPALAALGYRYDASGLGDARAWPRKSGGVWRFDLARLAVAGTGKRTISMDYNFYVAQSGAREDRANAGRFKKQMLATYLDYFHTSYTGNRAPVQIGHHFQPFMAGVYYDAIKELAAAVCGLPEVACVTYSTLADHLDASGPAALAAYQSGAFEKDSRVAPPAGN